MKTSGWTLRGRLIRSLTLSIILAWLAAAALAVLAVRFELHEEFDSVLQETAQHLLPSILADHGAALMAAPASAIPPTLPAVPHDEYITYQILNRDGQVLLRSHQAPMRAFVLPVATGFAWDSMGRRVYSELSVDGRHAIEIAEPAGHRNEPIINAILLLLLPLGGLVPVAIWLIRRSVRHGLRPLLALQREIADRSRNNLTPLPVCSLPQELGGMVGDVNLLLQRLAMAMEGERSFAANSAHELRTPVAAAMAQTQVLAAHLGEATPLGQRALAIVAELRRMSHLAERLLQLSRADAGVAMAGDTLDALPLVAMLVEDANRQAGQADRVRLETGDTADFTVRADLDTLGIAIRNLLDNALLHGTPDGVISLRLGPGRVVSVSNDGPLVNPAELATLTERFRRLDDNRPGSGLGLAIVDTIMRQVGGALRLYSPARRASTGFEAVLEFPEAGGRRA
jgi:two-component system OmpR family sensor kinase